MQALLYGSLGFLVVGTACQALAYANLTPEWRERIRNASMPPIPRRGHYTGRGWRYQAAALAASSAGLCLLLAWGLLSR